MSKVTELENALTELFRKGTEVGYSETEIDEFLEDIDYRKDTSYDAMDIYDALDELYSANFSGFREKKNSPKFSANFLHLL